jgi:hypothetical protein
MNRLRGGRCAAARTRRDAYGAMLQSLPKPSGFAYRTDRSDREVPAQPVLNLDYPKFGICESIDNFLELFQISF